MGKVFRAKFTSGKCPLCGRGIRAGELIGSLDDRWAHQACDSQTSASDRAEYAAGREDAERERFTRDAFGEEYAAAFEFSRDLAGLNGDW